MNSRNYDHVPPMASNTVTVATSSTSQVRLQPASGQLRSMPTVPMRQPVPIRKIMHDSGGGGGLPPPGGALPPPAQYMQHQVKEDPVDDYPGASTSSGPLIGPSSSNNFQQYQRGSTGTQSSSSTTVTSGALVMNNGTTNSMAMDQPAPVNLASKVAEVFLTAGHAFQKLGDLTLQLHTTADAEESKWSEKEVDNLKVALTRFAHELDQISTCVASRTTKHIKNDIKRRHLVADDQPPHPTKRLAMNAPGPSGTYTTVNSVGMMSGGHTVPLGQKRLGGQTMGKLMTARAVIPTTRYAVATNSANQSAMIPTSTVVVNSSQSPSPVGMPQLQSQSGPSSSTSSQQSSQQPQRTIITTSATPTTITRVMAPQQMLQGGGAGGAGGLKSNPAGGGGTMTVKRVMTPSSSGGGGPLSMQPSSGALILEHGDHIQN